MAREGIDFSGPRPTAEALRAAGRDFVVRYARCFTHPKCITAAEAAYWAANGIDVAIVDEVGTDRALGGRTTGRTDAAAARAAVIAVGGPADGGVIYCAVDFDATPAQMPATLDYIRGYADVLGADRTGVYGSYDVMTAASSAGVCRYFWQTYAWSGGRQFDGHLYQYRNAQTLGGVQVDYDRALAADFGQWGYRAPDGDDMSAEDVKAINDHTDGAVDELMRVLGANLGAAAVNNPLSWVNAGIAARVNSNTRAQLAPLLDDEAKLAAAIAALGVPTAEVDMDDVRAALRLALADVRLTTDAPGA